MLDLVDVIVDATAGEPERVVRAVERSADRTPSIARRKASARLGRAVDGREAGGPDSARGRRGDRPLETIRPGA